MPVGLRIWHTYRGMSIAIALGVVLTMALQAAVAVGSAIYRAACSRRHDHGEGRAPKFETLRLFPEEAIVQSLRAGNMRFVGSRLPPAALPAVAAYISSVESAPLPADSNPFLCKSIIVFRRRAPTSTSGLRAFSSISPRASAY